MDSRADSANSKVRPAVGPSKTLDWANLGVGISREVNGHVECMWTAPTGWSEPVFVRSSKLEISGLSSALNYGMQAYEGMKAVRGSAGQILLFRPDQHAARMQHSCEYVSIPSVPKELFIQCVSLAVAQNAEFVPPFEAPAALYIRPLALGTGAQLNIIPPTEFKFCVFVQPTAALLGHASPVDVLIIEKFDRAAPRGTGSAKIGGNYAPVMRWQRQAKQEGFGLTLHLDSRTQTEIEEFSAAGFIGVKKSGDGYRLVIPDSSSVIKSVTSDTCVQLANALGWNVETRPVKYTELRDFDEVLAVGTAAIVVPIRSIVRKSTSEVFTYDSEGTGKCFKILFDTILSAQRGEEMSTSDWNLAVHPPEY
ncbi:hypothetical protein AUEXF2481DRAFT_45303 [Aureobasidium subglaciale EXF-2481]|uniref:Branched-chain-amino-acid aminotransferase n=1 Tax=Aureobasidium subglaciale (strain EXF-2481) TaxID=1043005 RepID=A0A074Y7N5_AURSE|nr:uncharacterized protein AUEXF2481DRAFT_45303 [Aureobasidium subglaciale EXF-2481]KEQ90222.1 hypothetical protein AUEXF2481DRAFT_45303 [Aureobasidium subglaciale EXF-2481]